MDNIKYYPITDKDIKCNNCNWQGSALNNSTTPPTIQTTCPSCLNQDIVKINEPNLKPVTLVKSKTIGALVNEYATYTLCVLEPINT